MKSINKDDLVKMLRGFIYTEYKNASNFAKAVGCTDAAVSKVLNGKMAIPNDWLNLMGYESVTIYRKVKK